MVVFQRPLDRGDVLLSLSYLPTAERLILVVVKARNLAWPSTKPVGGRLFLLDPETDPQALPTLSKYF